jgi:DNA polymerase-3 subunit alpha/error-prone DNA polymerase
VRARLGLRSAYSLLYGVRRPEELVERAASYGASAVSVTDTDNLYGVHAVMEAAAERGLRALVGAELTTKDGSVFAFVRNRAGFSRLCALLTGKKREAAFDLVSELRGDARGLALASASTGILASLAGRVPELYGALSPFSIAALRPAASLGLPLLAVDDAAFLEGDDEAVHAVLRAIALGKTVGSLEEGDRAKRGSSRFLPPESVERSLRSWPEAIRNAELLAESCTFEGIFNGFVFPDYGNGESPVETLRRRVLGGAEKRYGELSDGILERIEYELDIIGKKGFSPYFLVMDDIVRLSSRTCGRGSGAASIVSYSLGITNVDPLAHRLYFERFLNPARPDPPDIDVDFAWDERDALIRRVIELFGEDRCARVANHNFFRPRSALRETAKAYGLAEGEIARMERALFELRDGREAADELWAEVLALAKRIEGLPRGLSMHCGGIVIAPGPISQYAPIERSAEGYPLLGWEKEGTEAAGFVKLDLLGNRSLAVIRDALDNLAGEGVAIDPFLWHPAEDEATISALAKGDSMGVFYIESPAMRQLQKKTGRGDFAHIVIHSSIIRPAANKFIREYVRRLKGGEWKPLHPRLARVLDETYGILCYQEDVSKTAIALAGFDEADADKLRKIIAKKAGGTKLALYQERFFSGCRQNGIEEKTIEEVWAMMLSFDGYSFCKPHSASYAMVSFQSAYLRVHHPAAFIAAVLSNQGGYYRPQAYVSEARRMGLAVFGPDVNRSLLRYRGEGSTLIVGFMAVSSLSRTGIDAILDERKRNGPFAGLSDFSIRVALGRDDIVPLVAAGAFDSLAPAESRAMIVRRLLADAADSAGSAQKELFSANGAGDPRLKIAQRPRTVQAKPGRTESELREEFASLGFLRDRHPLSLWSGRLSSLKRLLAAEIPEHLGEMVGLVGWPITQKEVWTAQGLTMNFVSFEDETGMYETVLFPEVYERHRTLLFEQRPLRVYGRAVDDQGAISIEVERLAFL